MQDSDDVFSLVSSLPKAVAKKIKGMNSKKNLSALVDISLCTEDRQGT